MRWKLKCVVEKEDDWYVSYCEELGIASQGETVIEAKRNLEEAIEMFFEDASQSVIMSLLAPLEPESPVEIRRPPEIQAEQQQEGRGTQWVLTVA
ncbi:MAG: type II toxin-antitoxin system HicB family antitoxin [Caldilineaceae bacterium]|nr:type II toxin-antitoxin system HicB family antitoxin [Caldilineaceae bacterium]